MNVLASMYFFKGASRGFSKYVKIREYLLAPLQVAAPEPEICAVHAGVSRLEQPLAALGHQEPQQLLQLEYDLQKRFYLSIPIWWIYTGNEDMKSS